MSLDVTLAVLACLLTGGGVDDDQSGDLHDTVLLLEGLLTRLIVVLDSLPRHFGEVAIKSGLVSVLADKNELELLCSGVDGGVVVAHLLREPTAAGSPVSSKVKADILNASKSLSKGHLSTTLGDHGLSK